MAGFGDAGDADVDVGDGVPGRIVGNAVCRKVKDALEGTDGFSCSWSVDSVGVDTWDGREVAGNPV